MPASANPLSAPERARLDTYMIEIAAEVRGSAIPDNAGRYRFGSPGGSLCVYANLQFHDFNGGVHGFSAFELIKYLHPREDPVAWARDWLARHPGNGSFVVGEGDEENHFAEIEAAAYIEGLVQGASPRLWAHPVIVSSPAPKSAACRCARKIKTSCAGSLISAGRKAH
jgi:hypothetical protein